MPNAPLRTARGAVPTTTTSGASRHLRQRRTSCCPHLAGLTFFISPSWRGLLFVSPSWRGVGGGYIHHLRRFAPPPPAEDKLLSSFSGTYFFHFPLWSGLLFVSPSWRGCRGRIRTARGAVPTTTTSGAPRHLRERRIKQWQLFIFICLRNNQLKVDGYFFCVSFHDYFIVTIGQFDQSK